MDAVIVAVVSTAVVQVGVLVGVAWSLGGRLARIEATMVTQAQCASRRDDDHPRVRLDGTGPVRLVQRESGGL